MPQTVVIAGASSGIGRVLAHRFARQGAAIGLIARNREALAHVRAEVERRGGRALVLPLDVSDEAAVEAAAERVERELGPIDVWINAAASSIYARFTDIRPDEFRRVVDVVFHGAVHGTRAALKRMVPRNRGAVVEIASVGSHRALTLQSPYSAAKFALRGFVDTVRTELRNQGSRVRLVSIYPGSVDTPLFDSVAVRMRGTPRPVAPVYAPELVADAVQHALASGRAEVFVGGAAAGMSWGQRLVPRVMDAIFSLIGVRSQQYGQQRVEREGNLFKPLPGDRGVYGGWTGLATRGHPARQFSLQLWTTRHRALAATALGLGVAAYILLRPRAAARGPDAAPRGRAARDWHADHAPGPDGRLDANALADEGSEDSFPASDPPSYMSGVTPGAPSGRRDLALPLQPQRSEPA